MTNWIAEARCSVADAASALGRSGDPRRGWPCPACNEDHRGSGDRRGAAGTNRDGNGWLCHRCGAKGDGLDYVSHVIVGKRLSDASQDERRVLRDWLIGKGWLQSLDGTIPSPVYVAPRAPQQPARPPTYLPAADVDRLWKASWQLTDPRCQAVPFLAERRFLPHAQVIADLDLARIAPTHIPGGWSESEAWPSWWSAGRAPTWRLVVRGWGPGGAVGFHGRAVVPTPVIDGKALPKALWARGYDSSGLLFWNRHPVAEAEAIFIAEGLTDWLTLSIWAAQRPVAVFGGTSGSWRGLIPVGKRAKPGADIVVAVDADAKGNEYAKAILAAFPGRRVFRTKPVSLGLSESDLHEHAEAAK